LPPHIHASECFNQNSLSAKLRFAEIRVKGWKPLQGAGQGPAQTVKKPSSVSRKGSGNEAFPERNPQSGLCPFEEKGEFQGFLRFLRKLME